MNKKAKTEALKAQDIITSISAVTKEKSISTDLVLDSLKDALTTAAKKYLGKPINVEAKIASLGGASFIETIMGQIGGGTDAAAFSKSNIKASTISRIINLR